MTNKNYSYSRKRRSRRRRKELFINIAIITAMLCILVCFFVIRFKEKSKKDTLDDNLLITQEQSDTQESTEAPTQPETLPPAKVTIMMTGDNLMHGSLSRTGLQADGSYDYSFLYTHIKPYLDKADISIANQEVIFGGEDIGLIGYPLFNTTSALGDSMVAAGYDVILHATNHALDQGLDGLLSCVNYWKTQTSVLMCGIYATAEEQSVIPIIERNGIKFAILNYTYSYNANTWSDSFEGHLNRLCEYDRETNLIDFETISPQVLTDIKKAETMADVVIVCPHWGTEYTTEPTEQEKKFAKLMTEAGADIIIGTHPHVIQPVEEITAANGNKSICFYSLGNFCSVQDKAITMLGGLAWITVVREDGKISIDYDETYEVPLVSQYVCWRYDTTYLLSEYTDALASSHGIGPGCGVTLRLSDLNMWANDILGKWKRDK